MQQRLNFRPLPQGQGWLRLGWPTGCGMAGLVCGCAGDLACVRPCTASAGSRRTAAGRWMSDGGESVVLSPASFFFFYCAGLLAPSEVLVAAGFDEGIAKSG